MDYERKLPAGYTRSQIVLHWVIVLLVGFQLVFGEAIAEVAEALQRGETPDAGAAFSADLHVYAGVAILLLAVVRLVVRLGYGAPPPPPGTGRMQATIANVVHWVFYALLFGAPISGLVAWYVLPEIGELHHLVKPVFILLIAAHVAASLYHQFVVKDGVMTRMVVPRS